MLEVIIIEKYLTQGTVRTAKELYSCCHQFIGLIKSTGFVFFQKKYLNWIPMGHITGMCPGFEEWWLCKWVLNPKLVIFNFYAQMLCNILLNK